MNKKADTCFQSYLATKGHPVEYWLFDEPTLDNILKKFWFEVRTVKGEHYMKGSLENLHYPINHVLHAKGHEFDIVHGDSFIGSQKAFKDACTELKKIGKGVHKSFKRIKPSGN